MFKFKTCSTHHHIPIKAWHWHIPCPRLMQCWKCTQFHMLVSLQTRKPLSPLICMMHSFSDTHVINEHLGECPVLSTLSCFPYSCHQTQLTLPAIAKWWTQYKLCLFICSRKQSHPLQFRNCFPLVSIINC
jgi:hypothetical protein